MSDGVPRGEDGYILCPSCAGPLQKMLELPGGRVVEDISVPFSDGVAGVSSFEKCRECGAIVDG